MFVMARKSLSRLFADLVFIPLQTRTNSHTFEEL